MGQTTKRRFAQTPKRDAIEDEVDAVIELCGGDARLAVRGLMLGQALMKREIEAAVSKGALRRRLH